jgi:hypothetical protein
MADPELYFHFALFQRICPGHKVFQGGDKQV